MTEIDMSEEVYRYGRTHMKYCSCGSEHKFDKISDVCIGGEFQVDVIGVYCIVCGVREVYEY